MQQVLLAGSFGSYLSPGDAVRIGLVPKLPVLRIVSAGNVAGEGAKMALLSRPRARGRRSRCSRRCAMSSSPTAPTSTTSSSTSCVPRLSSSRVAVIACGALAAAAREIVDRRGVAVGRAPAAAAAAQPAAADRRQVERAGARAGPGPRRGSRVGYADCGTYGALDEVCARLGLRRLAGLHCYDVLGRRRTRLRAFFDEPSPARTCSPTSWCARSRGRSWRELGLDRYPELRDDYFGNYRRVVWLAQDRTDELGGGRRGGGRMFGLPLTVVETGTAASSANWNSS